MMLMKTIRVYDPPMCCSTGVCGTGVDPDLANFAAMLSQLAQRGVSVERFNLGQSPMAFANNVVVRFLLEKEGAEVLPLVFLDGEILFKGRYPNQDERPALIRAALTGEDVS
jgi:hypothetical protein